MRMDYQLAFDLAPVGLVLSSNRSIVDCNQHVCAMFGATREQLQGQSFLILYPSADEYERIGAAHLMRGLTSKEIGRALLISHRTVEIYRARLMRKYKASTTTDLVQRLMAG